MILSHLTINGFKSFAKKSELEFSAPITAIVGPNGSGKSNVAEAFRFALGEQSVKSMRGKRGEDLIWGGSEAVSRGNRASVEVVFDNRDRVFSLDFDEVKIERVVHRDGQNEYFLNGSSVRLKDIQELLAAAHVGASGHHIISQGEADRILSASPKERREMIEDALGLRVYQYKKQEAERKLEKTKQNIEQVESLRREHAPHLKYLKKQVERVEKSIALRQELTTIYCEYLKREDLYLAYHADRLTAERRGPAEQLRVIEEQLQAIKASLRARTEEVDRRQLLSAEETLTKVRHERQQVLRTLSQLEGQEGYVARRLEEASRPTAPLAQSVSVASVRTLYDTIERTVERIITEDDISKLRQTLRDVVKMMQVFLNKVEPLPTDTASLETELQTLRSELEKTRTTYEALEQQEQVAETAYRHATELIEVEAKQNHELEKSLFTLVDEQRQVELVLERIDRERALLDRDRDEFKREVQEAVVLIGKAAAHYFTYELFDNGVPVPVESVVAEDRGVQIGRRRQLEKLKIRLEELGHGVTDDVLKEYQTAVERDAFLEREITDLTTSVTSLEHLIADLSAQIHDRFVVGIETITAEFQRFFVLMFGGGKAGLERIKATSTISDDEMGDNHTPPPGVTDGVDIVVSLPNKRIKGLEMLSGGERALTSIALIFAMSQVNPPPFIILDETDAALDEANSRRYGDMIEALAKKSQLILITHNRETMSRAGILYGVTMGSDGVSKLLSVKFDEAASVAK